MHLIPLFNEKFRQKRTVLPRNPRDQCLLCHIKLFGIGFYLYWLLSDFHEFCTPYPSLAFSNGAKHVFRSNRGVWPFLHFEDHRPAFQHFKRMPLVFRDVYSIVPRRRVERRLFRQIPIVIVEHHLYPAPQQNICLGSMPVPVYRQHRPRLQRIQQPLCLCFQALVEIPVHPQPRAFLGHSRDLVKQFVINQFHNSQLLFNSAKILNNPIICNAPPDFLFLPIPPLPQMQN